MKCRAPLGRQWKTPRAVLISILNAFLPFPRTLPIPGLAVEVGKLPAWTAFIGAMHLRSTIKLHVLLQQAEVRLAFRVVTYLLIEVSLNDRGKHL